MTKKLNEAQRKLVEDNHNLIYSFLEGRKLDLDSHEDWYGTAAIGLCQAASVFDESKGKAFSTLAYACMGNEVYKEKRKIRRQVHPSYSFDDIGNMENISSWLDLIPDKSDPFKSAYLREVIEYGMEGLDERDRKLISLIVEQGYSCKEAGAEFGICRAAASKVWVRFKKRVRDQFSD